MSKIQLVISYLKVAMLCFEQLVVAKVIHDVINHMNKYLMTYVNYDVDVCNYYLFISKYGFHCINEAAQFLPPYLSQ